MRTRVDKSLKREPGNHPGKTLSDVIMVSNQPGCQPVYLALALSLVLESDGI